MSSYTTLTNTVFEKINDGISAPVPSNVIVSKFSYVDPGNGIFLPADFSVLPTELQENVQVGYVPYGMLDAFEAEQSETLATTLSNYLTVSVDLIQPIMQFIANQQTTPSAPVFVNELLLESSLQSDNTGYFTTLVNYASVASQLQLTPYELTLFLEQHATYFGFSALNLTTVEKIVQLIQLERQLDDHENILLESFNPTVATGTRLENLAKLTGWNLHALQRACPSTSTTSNDTPAFNPDTIEGFYGLCNFFSLLQKTGLNLTLVQNLYGVGANASTASTILDVVQQQNQNQWSDVLTTIEADIAEQQRNALYPLVIHLLAAQLDPNSIDPTFPMQTVEDLSHYLLLDIEMDSCMMTSAVAQGTLSMQLYLQRCQMNLESSITTLGASNIDFNEQATWMKSYSVWEANRLMFLYPENYLLPNLRKNTTELFEAFQRKLVQIDLTQSNIEKLYNEYFNGFVEQANLTISGSYAQTEDYIRSYYNFDEDGAKDLQIPAINAERVINSFGKAFTIEAWICIDSFPSGEEQAVILTCNDAYYIAFQLTINSEGCLTFSAFEFFNGPTSHSTAKLQKKHMDTCSCCL